MSRRHAWAVIAPIRWMNPNVRVSLTAYVPGGCIISTHKSELAAKELAVVPHRFVRRLTKEERG